MCSVCVYCVFMYSKAPEKENAGAVNSNEDSQTGGEHSNIGSKTQRY